MSFAYLYKRFQHPHSTAGCLRKWGYMLLNRFMFKTIYVQAVCWFFICRPSIFSNLRATDTNIHHVLCLVKNRFIHNVFLNTEYHSRKENEICFIVAETPLKQFWTSSELCKHMIRREWSPFCFQVKIHRLLRCHSVCQKYNYKSEVICDQPTSPNFTRFTHIVLHTKIRYIFFFVNRICQEK